MGRRVRSAAAPSKTLVRKTQRKAGIMGACQHADGEFRGCFLARVLHASSTRARYPREAPRSL